MTAKDKNAIHIYGYISIYGSLFFAFSVFLLGLFQPGYNHFIDTISVLALGKYGWIQSINFIVLAVSFCCLGAGLGLYFYKKITNRITLGFILLSLCLVLDAVFKSDPVDRVQIALRSHHSQTGFIHFTITFIMIMLIPLFLITVIKKLHMSASTRPFAIYTIWVIVLNLVAGLFWYYCRRNGIGFEIKGIWQKGIVLNIIVWQIIMGGWLTMIK
jgi:hypothetical protein